MVVCSIGDDDVADLVNDVLGSFSGSNRMPATQGNMSCSKGSSSAAVGWMICAV